MNENDKLTILLLGIPVGGALYCALVLFILFNVPWAREHPLVMGAAFVGIPSIFSGSIWLKSSLSAKKQISKAQEN
jgi:hypothetical protein